MRCFEVEVEGHICVHHGVFVLTFCTIERLSWHIIPSLLLSMGECDSRFLKSTTPRITNLFDDDLEHFVENIQCPFHKGIIYYSRGTTIFEHNIYRKHEPRILSPPSYEGNFLKFSDSQLGSVLPSAEDSYRKKQSTLLIGFANLREKMNKKRRSHRKVIELYVYNQEHNRLELAKSAGHSRLRNIAKGSSIGSSNRKEVVDPEA